ncbi:MAG: hypothetical protein SFV21_13170 [Rhodospirillaceae bacterium]|nr:hypothetical protein [Rhodospirillaceae bacterium]
MTVLTEIENRAGLSRVTCGWKKKDLPLDWVRRYWRDVHSPAIARRAGVYDYRHMQFHPVNANLLAAVPGISYACPADHQLMWLSDVRYLDEAALALFGTSPDGEAKANLLGDIELIVDKSTTYRAVGRNAWTYVDRTGAATPQGPQPHPTYALFIRQKGKEAAFRACLRSLCERWAREAGVLRLRLSLFDVPDMEAEKKAGYPIKTHPVELQYQAWIDLTVKDEAAARSLVSPADSAALGPHIREIHAYPLTVVHTFVYAGRPTLVGLRGYPAYEAIMALGGKNQMQLSLLNWMYGPVVGRGPVETTGP